MDLTGRRKDIVTGTDWGEIPEEFAGSIKGASGFAIFRGDKAQFSVPVDQPFEDPPRSYKALLRGIPKWLDSTQVYYYLITFLAKYHLLMISGVEFIDDTDENTKAAWIVIDGTEEAVRILEKHNCRLEFSARELFQIPKGVGLFATQITLVAYANS